MNNNNNNNSIKLHLINSELWLYLKSTKTNRMTSIKFKDLTKLHGPIVTSVLKDCQNEILELTNNILRVLINGDRVTKYLSWEEIREIQKIFNNTYKQN